MIPSFALALLATALGAQAADMGTANDLSAANNVTSLLGTWSTGSGAVSTGGNFCTPAAIPAQTVFNLPINTGISLSFTDDGHFEEARYFYDSNPKTPRCIKRNLLWQHGTYSFSGDALVLHPFASDGRIVTQNACEGDSEPKYYLYSEVTTFKDWGITIDPSTANYALRLNRFDGAKMAPMYLTFRPPNMLPTKELVGTNSTGQVVGRRRSVAKDSAIAALQKRYSGATSLGVPSLLVGLGGTAASVLVLSAMLF